MTSLIRDPASYQDPSGYIFIKDDTVYRVIRAYYKEDYQFFQSSGLYNKLLKNNVILPHHEVVEGDKVLPTWPDDAWKILRHITIPTISYPYEWCFNQLKDAALLTLEIQKTALSYGMTLKDSSVYNVQFYQGRPVFIDTLSFSQYREGDPWIAYYQFCRHFLAPLALMAYNHHGFGKLLACYPNGLPLDLAANTLPFKARFRAGLLVHIIWHARLGSKIKVKAFSNRKNKINTPLEGRKLSKRGLHGIIDSLAMTIKSLQYKTAKGTWELYDIQNSYTTEDTKKKELIVEKVISDLNPSTVWDIGANTGNFSRIAAQKSKQVLALDSDHDATEKHYLNFSSSYSNILPLIFDITNPSPAIGWNSKERRLLTERSRPDLILALALIHHLVFSFNIPLSAIAKTLAGLAPFVLIEFIQPTDSMVDALKAKKNYEYIEYSEEVFHQTFGEYFYISVKGFFLDGNRKLFFMERK